MKAVPKHSQAHRWPSETVTVGVLGGGKGGGERAFYRGLVRDSRPLFPRLPARSRLLRALRTHRVWTSRVLAAPTRLGVIDTYGIELRHPRREGRSRTPWGRKGVSPHRGLVGGKGCRRRNRLGVIVGWSCGPAHVSDTRFHPLVNRVNSRLVVLAAQRLQAAAGDPPNRKLGRRGQWNDRMRVATVLAMMTVVSHLKHLRHRCGDYLLARLAFLVTAVNLLRQWHGLPADEQGFVPLSMAEFSL
ncbi:MAG TPA: transposase [Candidatus Competibacteraceae bacterium]|nr:transposase [Candidatus Competibacteraceae bacterium]